MGVTKSVTQPVVPHKCATTQRVTTDGVTTEGVTTPDVTTMSEKTGGQIIGCHNTG